MTKILVIEDEESVRENILELLDTEGFEALAGYGVLTGLRAEPKTASIPFIFLTAKAAKTDLSLGLELGAHAYITKPFTLVELLDTIKQVLLDAPSPAAQIESR
jgi:DNA-binding response OmpR family regulator